MKKLVSIVLALGLLLAPVLLYAAAATLSSVERISMGNFVAVTGIATINSGDTIATGLRAVIFFSAVGNQASGYQATEPVTYTASGGTVTVHTDTNGLRYRFFAIGTP